MADYKNLRLNNNDPAVLAELCFDEPKSFDAKGRGAKPGDKSYKFTLRLLKGWSNGSDTFAEGDEVGFWLDNPKQVERLSAFRKGQRIQIQKIKNADMQYADLIVQPVSDSGTVQKKAASNGYSPAPTLDSEEAKAATTEAVLPPRKTMAEAIYEAGTAII
jgi:hypothetical protein